MLPLERLWREQSRSPVLTVSGAIILLVAVVDWWTKPYVSLGLLYLFPIMFAAGFLPRWLTALVAVACAVLAEVFSSLEPSWIRLGFEALALGGCGLFVGELVRNRRLALQTQERLKALVETSPAAIVTVGEKGFIEIANRAALELLAPRVGDLIGYPIAAFLPELHHAVLWDSAPQFRASMQCRALRGNGEAFTADVWFSTYHEGRSHHLAAIIADVSEEGEMAPPVEDRERAVLTSREAEVLKLLVQGLTNKEIGSRMEISESAVKNTMQQLFGKTGVRTRSQLVRVALEAYRKEL
jgi:two-component system, LuxR family, sensor kinase FixL